MTQNNTVIFTTLRGEPVDNGAKEMIKEIQIPNETTILRPKIINHKTKRCIIFPIKHRITDIISEDDMKEAIGALYMAAGTLVLATFSIARTPKIDEIKWEIIQNLVTGTSADINIEIII